MKLTKIIIGMLVSIGLIVVACLLIFRPDPLADISPDSITEPSSETGFIGEKIVGDPEKAELIIYEYADFGCSHCAEQNRTINSLMEKYDGKIALVFRIYNIGQFKNSPLAARAATAADIQGYFKAYKDLLFSNQSEWYYESGEKLNEIFISYFKTASGGAGDIDKFKEDMKSDSVRTRLKFEQEMGKKINLTGTPTFRINGETIPLPELSKKIESLLNNQ